MISFTRNLLQLQLELSDIDTRFLAQYTQEAYNALKANPASIRTMVNAGTSFRMTKLRSFGRCLAELALYLDAIQEKERREHA